MPFTFLQPSIVLFAVISCCIPATAAVLHTFTGIPDGSLSTTSPILGGNVLFGTTQTGGSGVSYGNGTLYRIAVDGSSYSVLHAFAASGSEGATPRGALVLSGSVLYGTTYSGGAENNGVIFSMNTDGTGFRVLNSLDSTGSGPVGALTLDGNTLFGTYSSGVFGSGGLFKINTDGTGYTNLHSFTSSSDGSGPIGGLILSGGSLFGVLNHGPAFGSSTGGVFKVNTDGTGFGLLHSFSNVNEGTTPESSLVLSGSTLFGATLGGGTFRQGTVFKMNIDGTGYQVVRSLGATTTDAKRPTADLTLNGNTIYGVSLDGGTNQDGAIFKVNTDGTGYAGLYSFKSSVDGSKPEGGVVVLGNTVFGTTTYGSASIYAISSAVPEPTSTLMVIYGAGFILNRRMSLRRSRRSAT